MLWWLMGSTIVYWGGKSYRCMPSIPISFAFPNSIPTHSLQEATFLYEYAYGASVGPTNETFWPEEPLQRNALILYITLKAPTPNAMPFQVEIAFYIGQRCHSSEIGGRKAGKGAVVITIALPDPGRSWIRIAMSSRSF